MAQKKYVSLSKLSTFLDNLKNIFATISHKHSMSDITDYAGVTVDSELSSTSTNPVQNRVIDAEFDAMATAMGALELAIDAKANANDLTSHIDNTSNPHNVTKAQVGLGNVDNTSDNAKPVSTAQAEAIADAKAAGTTAQSNLTTHINNKSNPHGVTAAQIGAEPTGTASSAVSTHNTNTSAHSDIRELITNLTTRLNALADSDDTTLDQLSEIVAYIKSNKSLIDSITTSKINVSDIVNDLETNSASKVLSAAQGVAIKSLIDALQTAVNSKAASSHTHSISDVTNLQDSLNAKVSTSRTVNGKALSSDITLSASDVSAYSKTEIDNMELITVDDIDTICEGTLQTYMASIAAEEVSF